MAARNTPFGEDPGTKIRDANKLITNGAIGAIAAVLLSAVGYRFGVVAFTPVLFVVSLIMVMVGFVRKGQAR